MDLITQGILGGAIGQAGFQNNLGKKAVLWGALIGMVPDLDVLVKISSNPLSEQLYHRGFTHSLFFAPLAAPFLAGLLCRFYDKKVKAPNYWTWFWLAFWVLITHPLLDLFTTYGTQLLNPISNYRFSLSGIAIIDPLYSIPLLTGVLVGLWTKTQAFRSYLTSLLLLLTTTYLFYGVSCNQKALALARQSIGQQGSIMINSYPTLLQIHVRRLVAHVGDQVWIAYTTTYPGSNYPIRWEKYDKAPAKTCQSFLATTEAQIYDWFSDGDYIMTQTHNILKMQDLRFGFIGSSQLGIWGLYAKINPDGSLQNPPQKFRTPTNFGNGKDDISTSLLQQLFQASLGYESQLLGIYHL
ncbi:metal-dependent hydrolase [Candidatus Odyssella acanthamoebae]|uniref:metal-dependent hydrolase n=1 Tax=Candidatus Odyssella acanthamoebae TaxID=91604 RepID=UPI00068985BA|nr:metal-dependent hydrolase [Candidatus Paracaedibacter acanthamoebae]